MIQTIPVLTRRLQGHAVIDHVFNLMTRDMLYEPQCPVFSMKTTDIITIHIGRTGLYSVWKRQTC